MSYKCRTSQSGEERYARAVHMLTFCASHFKESLIPKSFELTTQNLASGCHLKKTVDRYIILDDCCIVHVQSAFKLMALHAYYKEVPD